jgi:hypothetical protein
MRTTFISALSAITLFIGNASLASEPDDQDFARVEVAFVIDTTGSMADLIDGAKKKIWSIASTIVDASPNAEISMALVAYRDRGDDYVVKVTPLSEDIQGLYGKLIKLEADGGNDTPESVNEALDKTIRTLQWTKGDDVIRLVFLVGDAPPHMDYKEKRYPEILKEAHRRDIVVNTVQAGSMPDTEQVWKEIARRGDGRYVAIPQSGGDVQVSATPYDEDITRTQDLLDKTALPYGSRQLQDEVTGKIAERAAASVPSKVENSKFYAKRKSKKELVTGGGDLVDDIRNKRISLQAVKENELPEELLKRSGTERKALLAAKTAERERLEIEMEELISKRDSYIVEQHKNSKIETKADSFDRAVEETLRIQLN